MADSVVETFEQLVRLAAPLPEMAIFLLGLSPKDTVAIRRKTKQLYTEFNEFEAAANRQALFLAGLATYSKQEALGRSFSASWHFNFMEDERDQERRELLLAVLRHSRPSWLTAWLQGVARDIPWQVLPYNQLRMLAAEGLVDYDQWLFAQSLANRLNPYDHAENDRGLALEAYLLTQFRADQLLLQRDLPLLFDYDTQVDTAAMAGYKKRASITWLTILPQLIASGHLNRTDILTRCLLALRRDFRRPLLYWFKSLYLTLEPTVAERLTHQNELVALLDHRLAPVVNFALGQLKDLCADPDFQLEALLLPAPGLLARPDITTSLSALLISLGRVVKSRPAQAPTVGRLYTAALANPTVVVQDRAAKDLAALLTSEAPLVSPTDKQVIATAIGDTAELLGATARALLAPWLATPAATEPAATYAPRLGFVPDLSPATAVVPVADWPELLFLTGQVLKHDDALTLERWLDGLLRLRSQLPPHYAPALQPYLQQLWPQLKGKTEAETAAFLHKPELAIGHLGLVQALLLSWARGFVAPLVPSVQLRCPTSLHVPFVQIADPLVATEQHRLAFAETLLREQRTLPLLSTPSHAPHWVAPTALVDRLLTYEAAAQAPHPVDLAVALARTAHAHPADAAAAISQLPRLRHAGLRALLAWLLAPVAGPLPEDATWPAPPAEPGATPATLAAALPQLWALAARTKQPAGEFPGLAGLAGVAAAGVPGVGQPWQPGWRVAAQSRTFRSPWGANPPEITHHWIALLLDLPLTPAPLPATLLYSLAATVPLEDPEPFVSLNNYVGQLADDYPFLLALLPQYPAPLHWHTLRLSSGGFIGVLYTAALTSLLGPGPCFDEAATLLLAHTLSSAGGLPVEVLLTATAQQRVVPAALGRALGKFLAGGLAEAGSVAKNLSQTRASSPAAEAMLSQLFAALLPELPATPPHNLRPLLETYADLLARTRQPVPAPVQAQLRTWQATTSLRKISKTLLAHTAT